MYHAKQMLYRWAIDTPYLIICFLGSRIEEKMPMEIDILVNGRISQFSIRPSTQLGIFSA